MYRPHRRLVHCAAPEVAEDLRELDQRRHYLLPSPNMNASTAPAAFGLLVDVMRDAEYNRKADSVWRSEVASEDRDTRRTIGSMIQRRAGGISRLGVHVTSIDVVAKPFSRRHCSEIR